MMQKWNRSYTKILNTTISIKRKRKFTQISLHGLLFRYFLILYSSLVFSSIGLTEWSLPLLSLIVTNQMVSRVSRAYLNHGKKLSTKCRYIRSGKIQILNFDQYFDLNFDFEFLINVNKDMASSGSENNESDQGKVYDWQESSQVYIIWDSILFL